MKYSVGYQANNFGICVKIRYFIHVILRKAFFIYDFENSIVNDLIMKDPRITDGCIINCVKGA